MSSSNRLNIEIPKSSLQNARQENAAAYLSSSNQKSAQLSESFQDHESYDDVKLGEEIDGPNVNYRVQQQIRPSVGLGLGLGQIGRGFRAQQNAFTGSSINKESIQKTANSTLNIGRQMNFERKQNALLISINCSKAVDNQNYKEQANYLKHKQQMQAASLRSQSIIEDQRQSNNLNNMSMDYHSRMAQKSKFKNLNQSITAGDPKSYSHNQNMHHRNSQVLQRERIGTEEHQRYGVPGQQRISISMGKNQSHNRVRSSIGNNNNYMYQDYKDRIHQDSMIQKMNESNIETERSIKTMNGQRKIQPDRTDRSIMQKNRESLLLPRLQTKNKQGDSRYQSVRTSNFNGSFENSNGYTMGHGNSRALMKDRIDEQQKGSKSHFEQSPQKSIEKRQRELTEESILFDDKILTSEAIFASSKSHPKQLMYNRAITKLRALLNHKGYHDNPIENQNFGLYHFHIDAMDNNIELNKFDTSPRQGYSFDQASESLLEKKHLMNLQDQSNSTIVLTNPHSKSPDRKPGLKRQETEDFISEDLLKSSPAHRNILRKRTIRNDQFVMQVRPTNTNLDDIMKQGDFSARQLALNKQSKQQVQPQRTILFVKEVDDNEKDYLKMEIKEFVALSQEDLQIAYNRLMKATVPVFSGGIDTLINKMDIKKVQDNPSKALTPFQQLYKINAIKDQQKFNSIEKILMEQLQTCKQKLEDQDMLYGQWSIQTHQGAIPDSREGATACMIDNYLYLFGGFSRDLFKDVRVFDVQTQRWRLITPSRQISHARFAHTMCQYGSKLYIFGGAGPYINSIKMRLSFNDIQVFDTEQEQWLKEPDIEGAPKKRQNHVAGILGSVMVVHGGFNTEQKKVLNDFGFFDIDLQKWISFKIYQDDSRIDEKHAPYDEVQDQYLGYRQMHSATAIVDNDYHQDNWNNQTRYREKHFWLNEKEYSREEIFKKESFVEGLYIFGGCNQNGHILNDIWILQPYYSENKKLLNSHTYEYASKPSLSAKVQRIDDFKGKAPCPRISHAQTTFKDWNNHHIIVIYGGRNDGIFAKTQNVAMNDICLFNVNLREWQALAIYGQMPCSRWSHVITMNGSSRSDGFLVFGGVNLKNYCKSRIFQFQIWNSWYKPPGDEKLVDEKLEILSNNVKEKIDIIKEILNKKK